MYIHYKNKNLFPRVYYYTDKASVKIIQKTSEGEEPFCDLTKVLGTELPLNLAYIDINSCPTEIIHALEEENLIENTGLHLKSGYVTYPLYDISRLLTI